MKIHPFKCLMAVALIMASLAGCGGGGGGPSATAANTVIKGTASAGIIYPGTVNVYSVDPNGTKSAVPLASVPTDINGKYSAPLGAYSGAIQVEVSGSYQDEATSKSMTIATSKPLHAVLDKVDTATNNNRVVSVTPLTEVAWRKAGKNGTTPSAIANANKLVSKMFKLGDIVGIEPVRPHNASMSNASHESKTYTLALAAMSKLATTKTGATDDDKFERLLTDSANDVDEAEKGDGSMGSSSSGAFVAALGSVTLGDDFPSAKAQLSTIGKKTQTLTLATSGTLPSGTKIYAIQGTITLPADPTTKQLKVSLRADSNNKTLSDVFLLAGIATGMGLLDPFANYLAPQQQVNFTILLDPKGTGIGIGDFASLTYEVATGATVSAADFSIVAGSAIVKDANGAAISGVTITLK